MKKHYQAILLLTVLFPLYALAQPDTLTRDQLRAALRENPALAGNNSYVPPFGPYVTSPAPKGYKPVYISHYGRHGARYITSASKYDLVWNLLENGSRKEALTPAGEDLYRRYSALYPLLQGHEGDLTATGQWQHRQLARRMVDAYPGVFGKKVKVDARATISPRAIISMMSFCDELRKLRPGMELSCRADHTDLYYTALASATSQSEAEKAWKKFFVNPALGKALYTSEAMTALNPEAFFLRYFKDMAPVEECGSPSELMSALGEIACNLQCLDTEESLDDIFMEEERFRIWEHSNLWAALMFTDNPYTGGIISARAYTLLEDIIGKAGSDLASGEYQVRLRFGHDTVVAPLMALLGIEGWEALPEDIDRWKYRFQGWNIPMASNFQLIFYRGKKGDILVKAMYNEKDQVLPLEDQSLAPYYRWEDFRDHYTRVCRDAADFTEAFISKNIKQQ